MAPFTLMDLVSVAGIPGVGVAGEAVLKMYETVDQVKVHKQRCKHLRSQCVETLIALRDSRAFVEGSDEMKEAIDIFEGKVSKVHRKMSEWAGLNLMKSIIKQSEISMGLDELFQDLQFSNNRFQIAGTAEISRAHQETRMAFERDHAELREHLMTVVRHQDALNNLLANTHDVQQFMRTIQEEIQSQDVGAKRDRDRQDLEETLYYLHKEADVLPPITDLTHEVRRLSEYAVAHGGDNDVYVGEWLGQEKVALKFTRGCNHSETAKKRFYNEVAIWRNLQHPNIVRLYGTATFGDFIYTVSPWMDNGDAKNFLRENPDVDRKKMLLEIAQGLNYLHSHGVAHGDLRCANILISKSRVARISDFGLSILVGDIAEASGSSSSGHDANLGSLRWRAPELIDPPAGTKPVITPATDVWSYGMLCLEVITGERPFHYLGISDVAIMKAISDNKLPTRPDIQAAPDLDNGLWQIMLSCWQRIPEERPSMLQVINRLRRKMTTVMGETLTGSPTSSPGLPSSDLPKDLPSSDTRRYSKASVTKEIDKPMNSPPVRATNRAPTSEHAQQASDGSISSVSDNLHGQNTTFGRPRSSGSTAGILGVNNSGSYFTSTQAREPTTPSSSASSGRSVLFGNRSPGQDYSHPPNSYDPNRQRGFSSSTIKSIPLPSPQEKSEFSISITPPSTSNLHKHFSRRDTNRHDSEFSVKSNTTVSGEGLPPRSSPSYHSFSSEDRFFFSSEDSITYDKNGAVVSGTLTALINRLLTETESLENDVQFRDAFLTCYISFSSAEEVYRILESKYRMAEEESPSDIKKSVEARYTVLTVMRLWLSYHRVFPKDAPILQAMRRFAESIASPTTMRNSASVLLSTIDKREVELMRPRRYDKAHSSKLYDGFKASTAQPRDFAIGFTILAWDLYSDLIRADFIAWLQEVPGREFVDHNLTIWNKLSYWTRNMILQSDNEKIRTARLALFIGIANECRKLRNYFCMAAIASACSSPMISRLRYTFGDLDKASKDHLATIAVLLNMSENYKAYRSELAADARQKRAVIPNLVIHTRDLKSLWDRFKESESETDPDLIYFRQHMIITEHIKSVLSHQNVPIDLERYREAGALAYLECQLDGLEVTEELYTKLEEKARNLHLTEDKAYRTRDRELRDAGFSLRRTPKTKPSR